MISYIKLNKILNNLENDIFIKKTKSTITAISNNKYQKIDYDYSQFLLSEVFYKSFQKQNTLNYKVTKYYYLVKNQNTYKRVIESELNENLQNGYVIYWILYYGKINPLENISSKELFTSKIKEIEILKKAGSYHFPKLLIHSCCGPCSSYVIDYLHQYFDITIIYYNPNIYPQDEYQKRVETQKQIIDCLGYNIKLIVIDYNHQEYLKAINGYETLDEGSRRCYECYNERLEYIVKNFKKDYDFFTTTLSISPYKNSEWINEIGLKLEKLYQFKFLYSDFKLNDGYKKSIELSKKYHLYRQDYCGCEYSLKAYNLKNK